MDTGLVNCHPSAHDYRDVVYVITHSIKTKKKQFYT